MNKSAGLLKSLTDSDLQKLISLVHADRELMATLIDSMPDEVWYCDAEAHLTMVNRAGLKGLGFDTTNPVRQPMAEWLDSLEIRTSEGHRQSQEDVPLLRSLKGEVMKDVEETVRHPRSGKLLHRQVSSAPLRSADGMIVGAVAVVRDITKRKLDEADQLKTRNLLETALNSIHDGISVLDNERTMIYANDSLAEIIGLSSGPDVVRSYDPRDFFKTVQMYQDDGSWLEPEDLPASRILRGESRQQLTIRYIVRGGEPGWALVKAEPVYDSEGGLRCVVSVTCDITAQKKASAEQRNLVDQLMRRDQSLTALSHAAGRILEADTPDQIYRVIGEVMAALSFGITIFRKVDRSQQLEITYLNYPETIIRNSEALLGFKHEKFRVPRRLNGFLDRVLADGKTVFVPETKEIIRAVLPRRLSYLSDKMIKITGANTSIIAPLKTTTEDLGVMIVTDNNLSGADVPAIATFAGQVSSALRLVTLNREMASELAVRRTLELELKAVNERMDLALRFGRTVVADVDRDLRYRWIFNPHPDFDPGTIIGKRDDEITDPVNARGIMDLKQKALTTGKLVHGELSINLSDGSRVYDYTVMPIADEEGVVSRLITAGVDVTRQRRNYVELEQSRQELKSLSGRILESQENERRRISLDLHDHLGQALTVVELNLSDIRSRLGDAIDPLVEKRINETISLIDQTEQQVRHLSLELRPLMLEDLGLVPTLEWYTGLLQSYSGPRIVLKSFGNLDALPEQMTITLYRIIQECLTNVIRHASAEKIKITISHRKGNLNVKVFDDGCGFDVDEVLNNPDPTRHLGLVGIRERVNLLNGHVHFNSIKDEGTVVEVWIPSHSLPDPSGHR